ncbi:MAG: hypothetical protein R3B13_20500 [Polyangiaceae bacterium]
MRALRVPTVLEWLLLAVGLALTWRYFWFMDDAFVYFRYVDNCLFLGRGLVFNPGEYVEGYSSPLWTLLLLVVRSTQLDWYVSLRGLALLFCVTFWATSVKLNHEFSDKGPRASLSTALSMTHYGVLAFFSSGLEMPLVQLAACAFALVLLRPHRPGFQVLAGLAPLIRPELTVPTLLLIAALWIRERRFPRWLAGSSLLLGVGWLSFRICYYADLFPNTYYLKDQSDLQQGYHYLVYSFSTHYLFVVLAVMLVAASVETYLRFRSRRRASSPKAEATVDAASVAGRPAEATADAVDTSHTDAAPHTPRFVRLTLLLCALVAIVYPLRVGGDMVYYRFLAFPICMGFLACAGVLEAPLLRIPRIGRGWRFLLPALGAGVAVASSLARPSMLSAHPATLKAVVGHYHGIADSAWHRQVADLRVTPERSREDRQLLEAYRQATPDQLKAMQVTNGGWCVADYRHWDMTIVHDWGLTEPVLARTSMKSTRPGHKAGLFPLSRQLVQLRSIAMRNGSVGRGMYRKAVEQKYAPAWVVNNLPAIEVIEKKAFNRHDFFENLSLALQRPKVALSR